MIDIHSHILWGLDDGAESLAQSVEMLEVAAAAGTTDIVATPHASEDFAFPNDLVASRIAELQPLAPPSLRLHTGRDVHLSFANIEEVMRNPEPFTINGGRYLLVEFSNLAIPPHISRVLTRMVDCGIIPIVTHPERNPLLRSDTTRLHHWLRQGCLIQVTAQSLLGGFGKEAQASAWSLVRSEMAQFVASDAHDPVHRPPSLDRAFDAIVKECDHALARLLLEDNPRSVLANEPVPYSEPLVEPPRRRWYQFWR